MTKINHNEVDHLTRLAKRYNLGSETIYHHSEVARLAKLYNLKKGLIYLLVQEHLVTAPLLTGTDHAILRAISGIQKSRKFIRLLRAF